MKKNRKSIVLILAALGVMAALIGVLAFLNAPKQTAQTGSLTVVSGDKTLAVYSLDTLKGMEAVEAEKTLESASYAEDGGLFRGVPMRVALESAGVTEGKKVYAYAQDGYVNSYDMAEVLVDDGIMIAYLCDGKGLGTLKEGGTGPLRVIVLNDAFGTRCCKYVYKIEVK